MRVAVIGSTGLVGEALVESLASDRDIMSVITIARKKRKYESRKVNQMLLENLNVSDLETLELRAEVFFCALGTTIKKAGSEEAFSAVDKDLVIAFAKFAKRNSARSLIIVSALGADKDSSIFYNKVKGEMEAAVSELEIPSIYFLRPSLLIGDREESRPAEKTGVVAYKLLGKLLPKKVKSKMGTSVENLIEKTKKIIKNREDGTHIVKDFD